MSLNFSSVMVVIWQTICSVSIFMQEKTHKRKILVECYRVAFIY